MNGTTRDELRIFEMTGEDAEAAAGIEKECFGDAWSADSLRDTIEGRASYYLRAEQNGRTVGYCGTQIVLDEGEVLRIAVTGEYRGRGIGSALMEALWERRPEVVRWTLEVRAGNEPAQALYRKYGFATVGIRKKYYHQPEEDAVIMLRECGPTAGI